MILPFSVMATAGVEIDKSFGEFIGSADMVDSYYLDFSINIKLYDIINNSFFSS
jgi:hypothetical protein